MDSIGNALQHLVHELGTPLAALDAALILLSEQPDDAQALASAIAARSHVAALLARASALLPTSRPMVVTPVDLSEVVHSTVSLLDPLLKRASRTIQLDLSEFTVLADAHALRQILINLVTNALKYAVVPVITISTGSDADRIWVEVCDAGPGIPSEQWESLLVAGARLDRDRSMPGDGLGLGLSAQLAASMGAGFELLPAQGTRVRVSFRSHE